MDYRGTIIEESLEDKSVLDEVKIISTKVEPVAEKHKTPWVATWTLHKVEVPAAKAAKVAEKVSHALDTNHAHAWYADYKTETDHYIIFRGKVFHITDRTSRAQYDETKQYALALGIPPYQCDFSPYEPEWKS
jgi:hypothetical protein